MAGETSHRHRGRRGAENREEEIFPEPLRGAWECSELSHLIETRIADICAAY